MITEGSGENDSIVPPGFVLSWDLLCEVDRFDTSVVSRFEEDVRRRGIYK